MSTRIYVVTGASPERLVRAVNKKQAIAYVVKDRYQARVATQDDLLNLLGSTEVEDASQTDGEDEEPAF